MKAVYVVHRRSVLTFYWPSWKWRRKCLVCDAAVVPSCCAGPKLLTATCAHCVALTLPLCWARVQRYFSTHVAKPAHMYSSNTVVSTTIVKCCFPNVDDWSYLPIRQKSGTRVTVCMFKEPSKMVASFSFSFFLFLRSDDCWKKSYDTFFYERIKTILKTISFSPRIFLSFPSWKFVIRRSK